MASDAAAKQLLEVAKNRLHQFYSPMLHETSSAPTFVQVSLHARRNSDAPPPSPESVGAYMKKGGESAGVFQLIDMLVGDLDREMTSRETEEKDSQADYEKYISDAATKRTVDSKLLQEKEGTKAEAE